MSDYIKITDYAAKDALLTGNPAKLVKGTEIGADFDAVAVAVATKHDATDIGVTVQAYDADLTTWAGVTPGTGVATALAVNVGTAGAPVVNGGALGTPSSGTLTSCTGLPAAGVTGTALVSAAIGTTVLGYVAPGTSGNVLTSNGSAWTSATPSVSGNEQALTGYYLPAAGSAYQDCYRAGFLPSWFNQQWGGAQWGMLPDGNFGSVATGNVQDDLATIPFGKTTTYTQIGQQFTVSEAMTSPTVWLKLYKILDPSDNVTVSVYSDTGSNSPNAIVGTAATIAAKSLTSKTDGEWYSCSPASGALSANTKYWVVLTRSGATSDTAYFMPKISGYSKYPHGIIKYGAAFGNTSAGSTLCFLIQNPAANSILQSGGMFDYKLAFNAGSPVNQSRSVAAPLVNFYDGKSCSVLYRGTYAVSTNVWDFCYGLDHDRITLTINGSGYPVLTIYESDRTVATVTGTGSVASGNHDVGIRVRTVGDGSDYATLYVDGVSVGTPLTAQTFTMDAAMVQLGTCRLGDGFGIIPAWTNDSQFTALPSTLGWSTNGTLSASESTVMSIQGGKLYQNKNGFGSADTFYYSRTTPTVFVNGTGWAVASKFRVVANTNTASQYACYIAVYDGTKLVEAYFQEYFIQIVSGGVTYTVQFDCKSSANVFTFQGKGSDAYLFANGKLIWDGTGTNTTGTATNNVRFGDASTTAGENADVIWDYVKYYQGGMLLPTASTSTCSEFAHWSGDKSALYASLWNSGSPVSVKQLCGVRRNYIGEGVVQREVRQGVTSSPTTASTTPVLATDMEEYLIGSDLRITAKAHVYSSAATQAQYMNTTVDGVQVQTALPAITSNTAANYVYELATNDVKVVPLGLHKVEQRVATQSGTLTQLTTMRNLITEARS